MTLLELCNALKMECGVIGADMTTTVDQVAELNRLVQWIQRAWMDIQTMRTDWDWMRTTATFPLVAGQPTYTTTQIGLTNFGQWARNTFRNYANPTVTFSIASPCVMTLQANNLAVGDTFTPYTTGALPTGVTAGTAYYVLTKPDDDTVTFSTTSGGSAVNSSGSQSGTHTITSNNTTTFVGFATEVFMPHIGYESWRDGYEFGSFRQVQTRPNEMTITPSKAVGVAPFPIAGYTVLGDYYTQPSQLASNSTEPSMPDQFHYAIVYRAMMFYGRFESAPEVYDGGKEEYSRMIRQLLAHQIPDTRIGRALA